MRAPRRPAFWAQVPWLLPLALSGGACTLAEQQVPNGRLPVSDAGMDWPADSDVQDASAPTPDAKCFRADFEPQAAPMEVLLLLDSSPFRPYYNLYPRLQTSLVRLVDLLPSGMALGMQVYPASPFEERCDPGAFEALSVAMQPIPQVAAAVNTVLADLPRTAATHADHPLRPVLVAALRYLESRIAEANGSQRAPERAVVLASHGTVYGCGEPMLPIAPLLREYRRNLGVSVYFLGLDVAPESDVGSAIAQEDFDDLSRASGSERSYRLGAAVDETPELIEALRAQQRRGLSCTMELPRSDAFDLDLASVRVLFDAGTGEAPQSWPLRDSPSGCEGGQDGFFYSTENARVLELCPASCAVSRAAPSVASLRVVADCASVIL